MITISNYRHLNRDTLEKYAGVKWEERQFIGDGCVRVGEHKDHVWYDEILISDEIYSDHAKKIGEKKWEAGKVRTTVRWYNFLYALWLVMEKKKTRKLTDDMILAALKHAENEFFDLTDDPVNIAHKLDTTYSRLLKNIEPDVKKYY